MMHPGVLANPLSTKCHQQGAGTVAISTTSCLGKDNNNAFLSINFCMAHCYVLVYCTLCENFDFVVSVYHF